jgi:hypothetical protein
MPGTAAVIVAPAVIVGAAAMVVAAVVAVAAAVKSWCDDDRAAPAVAIGHTGAIDIAMKRVSASAGGQRYHWIRTVRSRKRHRLG